MRHRAISGGCRLTMALSLPELQQRLLDLISPLAEPRIDDLGDDWQRLLAMTEQHRIGPLLRWRRQQKTNAEKLPEVVASALAQEHRTQTLYALQLQRELLTLHHILTRAGIPYVALKGAYLAWHAYPHPALRPLRDLDLLVPEPQVIEAYQALLDAGLTRHPAYQGTPEAALKIHKHLPPLWGASGNVVVELHVRLVDADPDDASVPDLSETPGFWERHLERPLAGQQISYTSPADLLLHLLVHAVCQHHLDNGPLLFSDILFLLDTHEIEWPLFWQLATTIHQTRGAVLGLRLTEHHAGKALAIEWPEQIAEERPPQDLLQTLARLTLRDRSSRGDMSFSGELSMQPTIKGKFGVVLRRVFPAKSTMASHYPAQENSSAIYFYYFAKWYRIASKRMPSLIRTLKRKGSSDELTAINQLEHWLRPSDSNKLR
jgi:hypothetical protein